MTDPVALIRQHLKAEVVDEYVKVDDGLTEEQHDEIRDWGGGS